MTNDLHLSLTAAAHAEADCYQFRETTRTEIARQHRVIQSQQHEISQLRAALSDARSQLEVKAAL